MTHPAPLSPRRRHGRAAVLPVVLALLAGLILTIAGCGGGVGVGGTGAYAAGPIGGFGSVFVNGIRFDDTTAAIVTEDNAPASRAALGLGMYVEVDSGPIGGTTTEPTATATRIRVSSQLVGPVAAKGADTLTMVGQTVRITPTTVFDDRIIARLPAVSVNDVLEVYGFFDAATGQLVATRVEPRSPVPTAWKVRGVVTDLNTAARTFAIGGAVFSYADGPAGQPAPANGAYVSVQVGTVPVGGTWIVRGVGVGQPSLPDLDRVEIEGSVTAFASATSFSVNGQPVEAGAAAIEGTGLALGARVEVRGPVVGGVLRATRVKVESASGGGGGSSSGGGGSGGGGGSSGAFEFKGTVTAFDPLARRFALAGRVIRYGVSTTFERGRESDLGNGDTVEVEADLTTEANTYEARTIRFEANR